jgi:ParB-like chromosome segregation protein Spo0J
VTGAGSTQETGDTTMPQFHELADAFPLITGEAFDELKNDIKEHGQLEPVVLFEGKILDGRNRWRAMQELDLPHKEIKLPKDVDPVAYVWSKNAVRRQLTPAQKALAATRLVTTKSGDNQHTRGSATSVGQAAEMAGVSDRSIQRAKKVLEQGSPEVVAAVQSGELGIVPAEALSDKPKELQTKLMEKGAKEAAKAVSNGAARKKENDDVAKSDGPGRGHVGPEVTMTRQMEASSAEGSKARTKLWAENKELITKLDPDLRKRFVADLTAERRAIEQLLRLIKLETEGDVPASPRTSGTTGADVPTEPVKVAAPKKTAVAKKTTAPRTRKPAAAKPVAEVLPSAAKKAAAAKSTTEVQETAK